MQGVLQNPSSHCDDESQFVGQFVKLRAGCFTGALGGLNNPPQGVPSMGRIYLEERSQSELMTATVAEPQGVTARRS
jgi:hypothetical protein